MIKKIVRQAGIYFFSFCIISSVQFASAEEVKELKNPVMNNDSTTWDCIYFGRYWQNDTNGDGIADKKDDKEPIKWRVLSVNDDDAFLLADQVLDVKRWDALDQTEIWEKCTIRSWLNGYGVSENKGKKDYSTNNFFGKGSVELCRYCKC